MTQKGPKVRLMRSLDAPLLSLYLQMVPCCLQFPRSWVARSNHQRQGVYVSDFNVRPCIEVAHACASMCTVWMCTIIPDVWCSYTFPCMMLLLHLLGRNSPILSQTSGRPSCMLDACLKSTHILREMNSMYIVLLWIPKHDVLCLSSNNMCCTDA